MKILKRTLYLILFFAVCTFSSICIIELSTILIGFFSNVYIKILIVLSIFAIATIITFLVLCLIVEPLEIIGEKIAKIWLLKARK